MARIRSWGRRAAQTLRDRTNDLVRALWSRAALTRDYVARSCARAGTLADNAPRFIALGWHRVYAIQNYLVRWQHRRGALLATLALLSLIAITVVLRAFIQQVLEPNFGTGDSLASLRTLIVTLGGALIGATAIAFSVVMFAVQINFARMPHGLFQKLSSDWRLLGSFAGSFLLAVGIISSSLIPDRSWVALVVLGAGWATIAILLLFLYAYQRALFLINPLRQLEIVIKSTQRDLRRWARRAERAAPLVERKEETDDDRAVRSTHDMRRTIFFNVNPHWTTLTRQAVTHVVSFARRYAEQGDHEVSGAALSAVVAINAAYVNAKGKTFFTTHLLFDNPYATDGFINETLEHLRQNVRIGVTRGDEEQIEQTLRAMAALIRLYIRIDYSTEHATKTHANLAAGYLSDATRSVMPHNLPDVLMEGVRLMGQSAQLFLNFGEPADITGTANNIAVIAVTGAAIENHRPVTLTAVEQFARLTFNLLRVKSHDIGFAVRELRKNISSVVKMFMSIPDKPLQTHFYFDPYYGLTNDESLPAWLTALANELQNADANNEAAKFIIHNVAEWSDGLYSTQKDLLLAAIERKSNFTFTLVQWIEHVAKVLVVIAGSPACNEYVKEKLTRSASWLISVLSWVPDDKDSVTFMENARMTETLFEAAIDARSRDCIEVYAAARDMLVEWSSKGGRHRIGWAILERSVYGLAALALWKDDAMEVTLIKSAISKTMAKEDAPDQEIRDSAVREIRRKAMTLRRREYSLSPIEHAMNQIDRGKMRPLLEEIANILSPNTANDNESVRPSFP